MSANLTPSSRYAVATRNTGLHTQPHYPIGEQIASRVTDIVSTELGVQAVALSSVAGSPWSDELARANEATGLISSSLNHEFFRASGFDGYVLISVHKKVK